jgi:hypothetical protein
LVPLAVLSESGEHEVVALLGQELRPVADHGHAVGRVAEAKLAALFDEPGTNVTIMPIFLAPKLAKKFQCKAHKK